MTGKIDEILTNPEGSPDDKTERPGAGEASNNTEQSTTTAPDPEGSPTSELQFTQNQSSFNSEDIDLDELRMDQDFSNDLSVTKVLTTIPIQKPARDTFFMVRSGPEWCVTVGTLELKAERETYIVHPKAADYVRDLIVVVILYLAITRDGNIFLIPVKMPKSDGKSDAWTDSRREAVEHAKRKWVRISANMSAGCYNVFTAAGNIPDPEWPEDLTFDDILKIAFRDRIIKDKEHPVVQKMLGIN